ncbi:MAG: ATP-binding protein [Actinomyces sp.]|uniref:ATP-binding protein n=1 Tax=Actinomyces sp. TaxID=29317 RepID=UPI0026DCE815|nr:ATP-binding protein [Actinomyces sp.]MDO4242830.1 ATP-binding protein [Actinomyces sp.]
MTVRPGVGMLALFPAMNYKAWYAIGEFVDNALQSWAANRHRLVEAFGDDAHLEIEVQFSETSNTITVTDNAAGISEIDIPRAFTPASPPADTSGLSQFGIGMKSAATWYANDFTVTTSALDENVRRTVHFDVPAIVESNRSTIPLFEEPAGPLEHGTTLILRHLNQPIPKGRTLGKIREYLQSIYRTFIADPDVTIIVQGRKLAPVNPDLLTASRWDRPHEAPVEWKKDVAITLASGAKVTGWAGLLKDGQGF